MATPRIRGTTASPGTREKLGIEINPSPVLLSKDFKSFSKRIKSARVPLHRSIKQVVIPSVRKNFDVGGRPAWEELSTFTENIKESQGYGGRPPLVRSGTLRRAATTLKIWEIKGMEGVAYVHGLPLRAWYGHVHQEGYSGLLGAAIPQRQFLMFQPEDGPKIERIFSAWINERLEADIGKS